MKLLLRILRNVFSVNNSVLSLKVRQVLWNWENFVENILESLLIWISSTWRRILLFIRLSYWYLVRFRLRVYFFLVVSNDAFWSSWLVKRNVDHWSQFSLRSDLWFIHGCRLNKGVLERQIPFALTLILVILIILKEFVQSFLPFLSDQLVYVVFLISIS